MYVRCRPTKENPKTLYYVEGYRDINGKTRQKTIKKIGDWADLIKDYDDPIAYFSELAKQESEKAVETIIINLNDKLTENDSQKSLGYFPLKKILNKFDLQSVFEKYEKKYKFNYSLYDILQLLVYSRALFPSSKNETYKGKDKFFEKFDFSLKDLYRALDHYPDLKDELIAKIWENTKDEYKRDASTTYYDCTNYYFEISYNDTDLTDEEGKILEKNYRKKGPSKENRKSPIVQMGLLLDSNGLPMNYELFPGNESEKGTLRPIINKTKGEFGIGRTIVVADRGLNTSDNTWFLAGKNDDATNLDGYVYGQSIRGGSKEFKEWVLKQDDYITDTISEGNDEIVFKHKSRSYGKEITLMKDDTRKNKAIMYQKQMVYYSKKYAIKQNKERMQIIEKTKDLINNPGSYNRATSYGCAKYIKNLKFNKNNGEIADSSVLTLREDLIEEESKYDGYYSIVTSEVELDDIEIRNIYKNLWKIEETFKITKSNLETRPVYVWTKRHIESHFLTCFISLLLLRLLEHDIEFKHSQNKIINSLKKYMCSKINHDIYISDFTDETLEDIKRYTGITLNEKFNKISKIKKLAKNLK